MGKTSPISDQAAQALGAEFVAQGYMELAGGQIRPTFKGILYINTVLRMHSLFDLFEMAATMLSAKAAEVQTDDAMTRIMREYARSLGGGTKADGNTESKG